jgi:hypothetical protein
MGGSDQSHKKVDSSRSWILYQYYTSKVSCNDKACVPAKLIHPFT